MAFEAKNKSLFPEKLIFSENQLRIAEPHVLPALITRTRADLNPLKQEKAGDISDLFAKCPVAVCFRTK